MRVGHNRHLFSYFSTATADQFDRMMAFTGVSVLLEGVSVLVVWWYMRRYHSLGVFVPIRTLIMGAPWFYVSFLLFAQTHATNDVYTARVNYDVCCSSTASR